MNNKIKMKKYFLEDKELEDINEDRFGQKDIVNNIELLIENVKMPYNIALIGKTGIGKSSIINLVLNKYEKNTEHYIVQKINVWKNKEENLKEIFNKEIDKKIEINESKKTYKNENVDKKEGSIKPFASCVIQVIFIFVMSILTACMLSAVYENVKHLFFREYNIFSFESFQTIVLLPVIIFLGLVIVKQIGSKGNKIEVDIKTKEKNTVNYNELMNCCKEKKIITIVEDIDKLEKNKVLEVLEEINFLSKLENNIFIVPLDERIIKGNNKIRFDKIFEYKIYIPELLDYDVKEYAINLVRGKIPNFILEYCDDDKFCNIIKNILIHNNIKTPRQVKRVINNFINNKIIVSKRIEDKKLGEIVVKDENFDFKLAKISVLQSDFNEIYNLLFKNINYLDIIIKLHGLEAKDNNIPKDLDKLFYINDYGKIEVNKEYESLINFLKKTEKYKIDNIIPYLYLTQDRISSKYGSEINRRLNSAIISNNLVTVKNILSEEQNDNIIEFIIYMLENVEGQELINSVQVIINIYNILIEFKKDKIEELIIENINKIGCLKDENNEIWENISIENLSEIIYNNEQQISEEQYNDYIKIIISKFDSNPKIIIEILKKFTISIEQMDVFYSKLNNEIIKENYDNLFDILRNNSDYFYEKQASISEYVNFLVNYIEYSSNPEEVIMELEENFTRISKIYELIMNVKKIPNIELERVYEFIAKCLDNGNIDNMIIDFNKILLEENMYEYCLNIEEKMNKYNLKDVIEYDVDCLFDLKKQEGNNDFYEYAKTIKNVQLLNNLLHLCVEKQDIIDSIDTLTIIENLFDICENDNQIIKVYENIKLFDRMYFYEIRKELNEILYNVFHNTKNKYIKLVSLETARYFKITKIFKNKLNEKELVFYNENMN